MRKIVSGLFISLDGVIEAPETWHFPYTDGEMDAIIGAQMAASDTLLFGRRTYEEFAAYWSTKGDDVPFAGQLNGARKLVASTTLERADWQNSSILRGDVAAALRRLRAEPGLDISITGSATLVRWLLGEGLLDELRLLVHPVVVGRGRTLFDGGGHHVGLRLIEARTLATGVEYLVYGPAESAVPEGGVA